MVRKIEVKPENFGNAWDEDANIELASLFSQGLSITEIAEKTKRNCNGITTQLERMGLIVSKWDSSLRKKVIYKLVFHSYLNSKNETIN